MYATAAASSSPVNINNAQTVGDLGPYAGGACDKTRDDTPPTAAVATPPSTAPTHDKSMAASFLAVLDPTATKFTFQLFGDSPDRYARVVHGSLDEVWDEVLALNTPERRVGVFVTINGTDFRGRRRENIVRARALFVDADGSDQVQRSRDAIRVAGAQPKMVVRTSPGRAHFYFCWDDVPLEEFSTLQCALIDKLGTDRAVKDLTRVMRLPGTLHLKNPNTPTTVTLLVPSQPRRWNVAELTKALGLSAAPPAPAQSSGSTSHYLAGNPAFTPDGAEKLRRIFGPGKNDDLSAGLETNLEEIRSAVFAIPPSAISTEPAWMKFMRGLAHEARIYKDQAEELWEIADGASRAAPGYDQAENRRRWLRYVDEALDRQDPITVATVFDLAKNHGWQGWSPPTTPAGSRWGAAASPTAGLKVSFAKIPHRRWLYGVDLIRGEITLLAAPGGVGKSSLAIGMSVSLAVGQATLEEKIWDHELTALYLNGEDSGIEMQRRIWAFCMHHHIAEQDLGRLLVAGADDWRMQGISLLRTEKGASLLDKNGVDLLETLLQTHRPDLLVLDPLVAFCGGGNVNDNAVMSLVMRALKRLAAEFNCAVLIIHHTRKGGDLSNAEAISGASAIVNLARRALMTFPMTDNEAKQLLVLPSERFRYFKVAASKSNLAPASNETPWYELCTVELPNAEPPVYPSGDRVQAVARKRFRTPGSQATSADDLKIKRAIADVVDRGKMLNGQSHPYSPSATGAKNQRALLDDALAAVANATAPRQWQPYDLQAAVERSINRMKADGWLVDEEITAGRFRRRRGLSVDWTRTPWPNHGASPAEGDPFTASTEDPLDPAGEAPGHLVNGVVND
jgi:AAA domain/RepB DNA-primase from phage plasmid/Primase C terminal 2 (PriCT-2)